MTGEEWEYGRKYREDDLDLYDINTFIIINSLPNDDRTALVKDVIKTTNKLTGLSEKQSLNVMKKWVKRGIFKFADNNKKITISELK